MIRLRHRSATALAPSSRIESTLPRNSLRREMRFSSRNLPLATDRNGSFAQLMEAQLTAVGDSIRYLLGVQFTMRSDQMGQQNYMKSLWFTAPLILLCTAVCARAPDNPIADGDRAYKQGDYIKAEQLYREGANDERWPPELRAAAQDRLGEMLSNGDHVPQDVKLAMSLFEKADALGNTEAPTDIGDIYFFGRGMPRDLAKAVDWYRKGTDRRSMHGMAQLAWCYLNGMGVDEDTGKARDLYLKMAQLGSDVGAYQLGWIFEHVQPTDHKQAMEWYLQAAAKNYALARNNIGYMYEHGLGVKKDYATAAHWYEEAANSGEKRGQYHLALLYEQGLGVDTNLEKATTLMRASAVAGDNEAMRWLTVRHISISP